MPKPKDAARNPDMGVKPRPDADSAADAELDEALEETFPASDPISPMQHRARGEPSQ